MFFCTFVQPEAPYEVNHTKLCFKIYHLENVLMALLNVDISVVFLATASRAFHSGYLPQWKLFQFSPGMRGMSNLLVLADEVSSKRRNYDGSSFRNVWWTSAIVHRIHHQKELVINPTILYSTGCSGPTAYIHGVDGVSKRIRWLRSIGEIVIT